MKMPHRFTGSGTIEKYGLVGIGVAVLEEMCQWGWTLSFKMFKTGPVSHSFLLSTDPDVEFSATSPGPCLPVCCHDSYHDNIGLNLRAISKYQLRAVVVMVTLHSNRNLNLDSSEHNTVL